MSAKVLVVDDSLMVRQQVSRALGEAGFEVVQATDGLDALGKVTPGHQFSLVVCDVNMPRMSGIEFLENVRKAEGGASLPVVMLTTEAHPDLIQRAKALGARGWIVKPFKAELLVAAVKKLVGAGIAAA